MFVGDVAKLMSCTSAAEKANNATEADSLIRTFKALLTFPLSRSTLCAPMNSTFDGRAV